jgi:hypothetical protein
MTCPLVSTDEAGRNTSLRGCAGATSTRWWALVLPRQGPCQQVKENLQVKQVTVTDVDMRVIICHKPSARYGLAALMYLPALFSVHPTSDPDHNREFALGANTASHRLATSRQVFALIPLTLGMFALYATIAHTRAARWAINGLIATVVGAGCLLMGGGYAVFVMPAAGVLIGQGGDQDVLRLLDQVFA